MKVWMRPRRAGRMDSAARSTSPVAQRASAATTGSGNGFGNPPDGLRVVLRRNREAGFDDVDAQKFELAGQADLLLDAHRESGACSPSRRVVSKMTSRPVMVSPVSPRHGPKSTL